MKYLILFFTPVIVLSCLSNLQTTTVKKEGLNNKEKGLQILEEAWLKHGLNNLKNYTTYEVVANDYWKGALGKIGTMWPNANVDIRLKYAIGTFDGNVTFLNGRLKDVTKGIQSWRSYTIDKNSTIPEFHRKPDKKTNFGISALQYFFELLDRLKNVELITYAGEKEFNNKTYQLVFATWGKLKPNKKNDQYLLWINKTTKMLEFCEFTVRDPFILGGGISANTIVFENYKMINGIMFPFLQTVKIGEPNTNKNKFVHQITISSVRFDSFNIKEVQPDPFMKRLGDSK